MKKRERGSSKLQKALDEHDQAQEDVKRAAIDVHKAVSDAARIKMSKLITVCRIGVAAMDRVFQTALDTVGHRIITSEKKKKKTSIGRAHV